MSTDPFLDDESSIESSMPREYALIEYDNIQHRIAFTDRDILGHDGFVYTAIAAARGELSVAGAGKEAEMLLTLPIDHALTKRWLSQGIPPKRVAVTIWRLQTRSNLSEQIWTGDVSSMSWGDDGTEATFRIPARASEALLRVIPNVTAGHKCPHRLGDATCRIDLSGNNPDGIPYKFTGIAISVVGRDVQIDLVSVPADYPHRAKWTVGGELKFPTTGDSVAVLKQTDLNSTTITTLTMQMPIVGLRAGSVVEVTAGCDHLNTTCNSTKFSNISNHGGCTFMPTRNPFVFGLFVTE